MTSGAVSWTAKVIRARDKLSELKDVDSSYTNMLGQIISTFKVRSIFAKSLGTDSLKQYERTFDEGQVGFKQANQPNNEAAAVKRTKNAVLAIHSLKLLFRYRLHKIKDEFNAAAPTYLACVLQVRLFGWWTTWGS